MKKKTIIIIIVAIVIIALLFAGWWFFLRKGDGSGARKAFVMPVKQISSNAMISGVSNRYSGIVEPQETKDVQADSSKTVGEVFVKVGDFVKAGDPLFKYKVDSMKLDLEQLNVDLQSAQATVKEWKESYENAEGTDKEINHIRLIEAQGQVSKVLKSIEAKKQEINNSVVNSPIEGTIQNINNANDQMYDPSSAFITIMAEGKFLVKSKISEMNVYQISVGQQMLIRSRVDETKTWTGTIASIDTSSTENNNNNGMYIGGGTGESASKYSFFVSPDNAEGLLIGQHVTVEPSAEQEEQFKGILLGEYYIADLDSKPFVWKDVNGRLQKSYIEIGKYNEMSGEYEVLSGLDVNDSIAYPDDTLKEGMDTTTEYIPPDIEEEMADPGVIDGPGFENFEGEPGAVITEGGEMMPGEDPAESVDVPVPETVPAEPSAEGPEGDK